MDAEPSAALSDCFGFCADCGVRHEIPRGNARAIAREMMQKFESLQRLDYLVSDSAADPELSFDHVFRPGHGNMFGVMECEDSTGNVVVLRAFSSLQHGIREVDGWVLPVLGRDVYEGLILPAQAEIKRLTEIMNSEENPPSERGRIAEQRRGISQGLWDEMCRAYRFRNFRGEERSLLEAVVPGTPITGGMGECCAPKLLQHAARHSLRPLSLAEFYWSPDGAAGDRVSGQFYPSCSARCEPLIGFLLCGVKCS